MRPDKYVCSSHIYSGLVIGFCLDQTWVKKINVLIIAQPFILAFIIYHIFSLILSGGDSHFICIYLPTECVSLKRYVLLTVRLIIT